MRIGIDCRMMGKGFGIGRYIEQLVLYLLKHANHEKYENTKVEYILFLRRKNWDVEKNYSLPIAYYQKVLADIPHYSWAEQTKLPSLIKAAKVDLMHFPHWNVPLAYNDPFIVTIHDLTMFHYPRPEATTLGPMKFWFKDKAHRLVIRHAVKRARHIIAMSEWVKNDVHETLGVPLPKMTVTYQAPFSGLRTTDYGQQAVVGSLSSVVRSYGITKPYVLYVGAAYPHKNLEGLLKAWEIFCEKYGNDYQLVLAGKEDYFYKRLKKISLTPYPLPLTFIGFVPDDELSVLYQHAKLFISPSLSEGFGLPPLEAMAHGVPVVSSNRSCLPEVLGEAALYFDPENYEQMAEVMYRVLTDEEVRFQLRQKAREELKRYSWGKLARETIGVYGKVASKWKLETRN